MFGELLKWYDLASLDISNLTLEMIPDFTAEMEARRKELFAKLDGMKPETKTEREEYATLEFVKAADIFRDLVGKIFKLVLLFASLENQKSCKKF